MKYNSRSGVSSVLVSAVRHSVQEVPGLLELVLPVPGDQVVQVPGGVPGRIHLVGRVERRKVNLEFVVVLSVQLHLLKPVTPKYLTRKIGGSKQEIENISDVTQIINR